MSFWYPFSNTRPQKHNIILPIAPKFEIVRVGLKRSTECGRVSIINLNSSRPSSHARFSPLEPRHSNGSLWDIPNSVLFHLSTAPMFFFTSFGINLEPRQEILRDVFQQALHLGTVNWTNVSLMVMWHTDTSNRKWNPPEVSTLHCFVCVMLLSWVLLAWCRSCLEGFDRCCSFWWTEAAVVPSAIFDVISSPEGLPRNSRLDRSWNNSCYFDYSGLTPKGLLSIWILWETVLFLEGSLGWGIAVTFFSIVGLTGKLTIRTMAEEVVFWRRMLTHTD